MLRTRRASPSQRRWDSRRKGDCERTSSSTTLSTTRWSWVSSRTSTTVLRNGDRMIPDSSIEPREARVYTASSTAPAPTFLTCDFRTYFRQCPTHYTESCPEINSGVTHRFAPQLLLQPRGY